MDNKIVCINPKCKAELKRPQCPFIKCPICKTDFFVFCHQFPYRLFEHVACNKCPTELYYFFCFKCSGLLSYNKYRMGSISACSCGFKGCYVVCNKCKRPDCFPPTRRYEATAWKCPGCKSPFNFITCDRCFYEIYETEFEVNSTYTCKNKLCRSNITMKNCEDCTFLFADSRGKNSCEPCLANPKKVSITNQTALSKTQTPTTVTTSNESSLQCKVCLDKQAEFLNTKCFHLSVCAVCVKSMKNQCPICRAIGDFHKVYK